MTQSSVPSSTFLEKETCLVPHAVSHESARIALAWIKKLPDHAWSAVVEGRSKDRSRIKFSAQRFFGRAPSWDTRVPPELLVLGEEAVEAARSRAPDAPWENFEIDTLVLNRYRAKKGVAAHKDPETWVPLVVGVTLYDNPEGGVVSAMKFTHQRNAHTMPTPHRSAYVFHSRAYTEAEHARKPCGSRLQGHAYSFTFRSYAA
jgi:hypothetical protein